MFASRNTKSKEALQVKLQLLADEVEKEIALTKVKIVHEIKAHGKELVEGGGLDNRIKAYREAANTELDTLESGSKLAFKNLNDEEIKRATDAIDAVLKLELKENHLEKLNTNLDQLTGDERKKTEKEITALNEEIARLKKDRDSAPPALNINGYISAVNEHRRFANHEISKVQHSALQSKFEKNIHTLEDLGKILIALDPTTNAEFSKRMAEFRRLSSGSSPDFTKIDTGSYLSEIRDEIRNRKQLKLINEFLTKVDPNYFQRKGVANPEQELKDLAPPSAENIRKLVEKWELNVYDAISNNKEVEPLVKKKGNEEYRKLYYIAKARGRIQRAENSLSKSKLGDKFDHLIDKMKDDFNEALKLKPTATDIEGTLRITSTNLEAALNQVDDSIKELDARKEEFYTGKKTVSVHVKTEKPSVEEQLTAPPPLVRRRGGIVNPEDVLPDPSKVEINFTELKKPVETLCDNIEYLVKAKGELTNNLIDRETTYKDAKTRINLITTKREEVDHINISLQSNPTFQVCLQHRQTLMDSASQLEDEQKNLILSMRRDALANIEYLKKYSTPDQTEERLAKLNKLTPDKNIKGFADYTRDLQEMTLYVKQVEEYKEKLPKDDPLSERSHLDSLLKDCVKSNSLGNLREYIDIMNPSLKAHFEQARTKASEAFRTKPPPEPTISKVKKAEEVELHPIEIDNEDKDAAVKLKMGSGRRS